MFRWPSKNLDTVKYATWNLYSGISEYFGMAFVAGAIFVLGFTTSILSIQIEYHKGSIFGVAFIALAFLTPIWRRRRQINYDQTETAHDESKTRFRLDAPRPGSFIIKPK